jgi:hypothetical protein
MPLGLRFAAAFALGSMFGGSGAVSAQSVAGGANLQIPPDVRAESMGGVWAPLSTTPYAAWGNVGGLGLLEGFQAAHMDAQLVPGLADDVHVYYRSVVYGHELDASGLRASIGYNRTDLNYGKSVSTDPGSPDPLGTFESTEHTNGITLAVGYRDVIGVGFGFKSVQVDLVPPELHLGGGSGGAHTVDYGILARTPSLELRPAGGGLGWGAGRDGMLSARMLGGMGWSNRRDDISLVEERSSDPLPAVRRDGLGIEIGLVPVNRLLGDAGRDLPRLFEGVDLVSFAGGVGRTKSLLERDIPDSLAAGMTRNEREGIIVRDGYEIRLLGVVSYRRGTILDDAGKIWGKTEGWGVSFFGHAGFDFAEIPQFEELQRVKKWSAWVRIPVWDLF